MNRTTTISAIAAGAMLLGSIAGEANAATARIAPLQFDAHGFVAPTTLIAHAGDACRMLVDHWVVEADRGGAILPVYDGRRVPVSACQRTFEDGSALRVTRGEWPLSILRPGRRYFLGLRVWSHARPAGSRWISHTFVRSFTAPRWLP
jgi:hypothetical protein